MSFRRRSVSGGASGGAQWRVPGVAGGGLGSQVAPGSDFGFLLEGGSQKGSKEVYLFRYFFDLVFCLFARPSGLLWELFWNGLGSFSQHGTK